MPVCGNYLFFELPKKIVLNPKDGSLLPDPAGTCQNQIDRCVENVYNKDKMRMSVE